MVQAVREASVWENEKAEVHIALCKTVAANPANEIGNCCACVWGLEVHFSNGQILYIPDICTKRCDIDRLKARLEGADLCPFSLREVIEDYLAELYGCFG